MSINDNSSKRDLSNSLFLEYKKLKDNITYMIKNHESLNLEKIVGLYFQVINLTSMVKSLNEKNSTVEINSEELEKILEIEKYIDEEFNSHLHPLLIANLEKSIKDFKIKLKDIKSEHHSKTKNEIENQAKAFEELRQIMSTREFVNQYDKVLEKSK